MNNLKTPVMMLIELIYLGLPISIISESHSWYVSNGEERTQCAQRTPTSQNDTQESTGCGWRSCHTPTVHTYPFLPPRREEICMKPVLQYMGVSCTAEPGRHCHQDAWIFTRTNRKHEWGINIFRVDHFSLSASMQRSRFATPDMWFNGKKAQDRKVSLTHVNSVFNEKNQADFLISSWMGRITNCLIWVIPHHPY